MKKLFVMSVFVSVFLGIAVCSAEALSHEAVDVVHKITFDYAAFNGTISGICLGDDTMCAYSVSSYIIVDIKNQEDIIASYKINHPNISEGAPYIQQVIYENGSYYLLVFDHAERKSYIISQHRNRTEYGATYTKEIRSFALINDGFFLTGIDEMQHPWLGRIHATGDILWEAASEYDRSIPVYCTAQDEHILIVSQSSTEPSLSISFLNDNGVALASREIRPSSADNGSVYHVFQVAVTADDIAMCGERISKSECLGFIIHMNHDYSTIVYREYPRFMRIRSFVDINGHYTMLALADIDSSLPYARYIISEANDSLYPLEKRDSLFHTIALMKGINDEIYIYGRMENSVTEPDSFIAEINIK